MGSISRGDYELLIRIRDHQPVLRSDVPEADQNRVNSLIRRGILRMERRNPRIIENPSGSTVAFIGFDSDDYLLLADPDGSDALEAKEKEMGQEAKDEKQRRFQNQVSVANVLVPLISFVLGLVVEHYAGIIRLLSTLAKQH